MQVNNEEALGQDSPSPTKGITKRVVRGGLWVFGLRTLNRTLGLIRTLILARLLAPEDFGLLGIALLSIATLETFSQAGFQTALIQKKENVEAYLDTAWTFSALRGIILFLVLFSSAPLIGKFFDSSEAVWVIRVLALSFLLSGFKNIGIVFFQKELEFGKSFFYELSSTVVNLTFSVTLAFILKSVWALVWGSLAGSFATLIMSYALHPYRARIHFQKDKFADLFGFGRWVLGSSILVFLNSQGDDIFVGKVLGVAALGFYQMAYLLSNLPATEITHIISRVTFPAYSKLQDDLAKLGRAYLRVLKLTSFISIPLGGAIFIFAPEFTSIFLGEKWMPMVPAIQVLVFWGVLRSLGATTGPALYSFGKPDLATKLQFIQFILLIILIYPLSRQMGIIGTSLAVVFAAILPNSAAFLKVTKITNCGRDKSAREIILPLAATLFATLLVMALKTYQPFISSLAIFLSSVLLFSIIYIAVICLFEKFLNYGIWPLIKDLTSTVVT
jgi:O-antigen/teichoic acid export membrane protein